MTATASLYRKLAPLGAILAGLVAIAVAPALGQSSSGYNRPSGVVVDTEYVSPKSGADPSLRPMHTRQNMHACARRTRATNPQVGTYVEGGVVTGVHVDGNRLICADRMQIGGETLRPPVGQSSVTCPPGQYVTGVRADRFEVLCAPLFNFYTRSDQPLPTAVTDPQPGQSPTQRHGMHACPRGYGLVGLELDQGAWSLKCSRFPICWASRGHVPAGGNYQTPCAAVCSLPASARAGQGSCS